jgi:NAD(P)-dependent dehydrogenase (short-subunit alcohol dehydrogenase family)
MRVTIVDIRGEAVDKAVAELKGLGIDALGIQMDLTNREQYVAAADKAERHWGAPPQLLIQTAGVNTPRSRRRSTFEDYDWGSSRQLNGVVNGMVIFCPADDQGDNITRAPSIKTAAHRIVSSMGGL